MKAVLFLCLLAFMACEKDIIDIGKCIYKAPLVKELINDVIVAIATKDYSKLLPKIKESIPELIKIVLGCIIDTKTIEDEAKLEVLPYFPPPIVPPINIDCLVKCFKLTEDQRKACFNDCNKYIIKN